MGKDPLSRLGFAVQNGILYHKGRVVISSTSKFIPLLLQEFHGTRIEWHSGYYCTYRRLAANLYWVGMSSTVQRFVQECEICQQSKSSILAPRGLLQPLDIPDIIWEQVSMDFISGLPKSRGHDAILVVVDRLSKYNHFILLKHPYIAQHIVEVFMKEIVRLHRIPKSILSDCDPLFMRKFWQEIFHRLTYELIISP